MKANGTDLLSLLNKPTQFIIPIYQRTYSWGEPQCQQLWEDILHAGNKDKIAPHFIGSIVYIEKEPNQVSDQSSLLVIDGQQRMTTVMLIIEALARCLGNTEPVDGFSAQKLRTYYLLNRSKSGERRYKLLLTLRDKATLLAFMEQKPLPSDPSLQLKKNFEFFREQMQGLGPTLELLCRGLANLMVVEIALSRDQDNPQLIFERMNSTALQLREIDKIRNFILMSLEFHHQNLLYKGYWKPIEDAFGQEDHGKHFDRFMRDYLTIKTNEIPKQKKVYEVFKKYAGSSQVKENGGVDELVADIRRYSKYYCAMVLNKEKDPVLKVAFEDLRELKADVVYPFLLELYKNYAFEELSAKELEQNVRMVESYVFRSAVCGLPSNPMNKTFATFGRTLREDQDPSFEKTKERFLSLLPYRRFPLDEEFIREIEVRNLYNFRSRSYWLWKLENHGRKERARVEEYSIEHIMPQKLSDEWKAELGDDWQEVHDTWLHTLGNLTLTGYNPEYSNRLFSEKRDMQDGFKESPLWLNEGLGDIETWDEAAIQERAARLAKKAVEVWAAPDFPDGPPEGPYPPLGRRTRILFDAFHKEVRSLDSRVTERFRQHHIAYKKVENNFVCVEPQKSRCVLFLNLKFHELQDPLKIAEDVTGVGHQGTGNVRVDFEELDDLAYIMGLVRQAFDSR